MNQISEVEKLISDKLSCPDCEENRLHIDQGYVLQLVGDNAPESFRLKISIDCQNAECSYCKDVFKTVTVTQHDLRTELESLQLQASTLEAHIESLSGDIDFHSKKKEEKEQELREVSRKIRHIGQQERQEAFEQTKKTE